MIRKTVLFVALLSAGAALAQSSVPSRQAPKPPEPAKTAPTTPAPSAPQRPAIERDPSILPDRVAAMRERIIEAAKSGDPEKLRIAIERNEVPPVMVRGAKGDGVKLLTGKSGDPEGREVLARLLDILDAPFVHIETGKPQEMYVWPAFAELPLDSLTPEETVELYRVAPLTVVKESREKKKYLGDRIGIGPDGTWHYFLSGE